MLGKVNLVDVFWCWVNSTFGVWYSVFGVATHFPYQTMHHIEWYFH